MRLHGWKNPGAGRAQYFVIALGRGRYAGRAVHNS